MDWALWFFGSGVIFSLGFYLGHRLGFQEGMSTPGRRIGRPGL